MSEVIIDTFLDGLKLLPFLFFAFLLLEFIEHKMNSRVHRLINKAGVFGPAVGGLLGAVPQCGFSAMASGLYATGVITLGTLISVFLSTSDEMLIIMLASPKKASMAYIGFIIIIIKVIIGIVAGFLTDFILKLRKVKQTEQIRDFCEIENCHCEHGIFRSAVHHTVKILLFILLVTLILNTAIHFLGEETLSKLLLKDSFFAPFLSALVGLIPNCASSVVITEMYINGAVSLGSCIAGLLAGSGMGLLILFKVNRPFKNNIIITLIVYGIGVFCGVLIDLAGFAL